MIRNGSANVSDTNFATTVARLNGSVDEKLLAPLVGNTVYG